MALTQFRTSKEIVARLEEDRRALGRLAEFWAPHDTNDLVQIMQGALTGQGVKPSDAEDLAGTFGSWIQGMREGIDAAVKNLGSAEHVVSTSMPRAVRQARSDIAAASQFVVK